MTIQKTITLSMTCNDLRISLTEEVPGIVEHSCGAMSIDSGLRPAVDRMARAMAQLIWDAQKDGDMK